MIRIIADDKIPFLKGVLEPFAEVTYLTGNQITSDLIKEADALLVRTRTRCNKELLENSAVKFVGTATIGFDHIDTAWCEKNNIKWTNAPGCNSSSVQQYIAAALLRISGESGFELRGKTIGIVGVGNVGSKVAKLAGILGMDVLLNDPPRERREGKTIFVNLNQLLYKSDIISLHVPLNSEGEDKTLHFFNGGTFGELRKSCWLINTSRGEVVETDALTEALSGERIAGAVLDVYEKEPEIDIPLMHMAFLATPHIAGYSADGKANGTAMVVNSLCEFFNFPLTGWYPADIPLPENPLLILDCNGKSDEEIIRRAVLYSYNIVEDDVKLRFDPSRFETLRESYQLRREAPAYLIKLNGGTARIRETLNNLGFTLAD